MKLELDDQKTILVGANNSGKTSCIGALHTFLMQPNNLRVRDISKQHWKTISAIGKNLEYDQIDAKQLECLKNELKDLMPQLDVNIHAEPNEAYRARDILPHLQWKGGLLSVRLVFEPKDIENLAKDFSRSRSVVAKHDSVSLWPTNLFDFLEKGSNFRKYMNQKNYILSQDIVDGKYDTATLVKTEQSSSAIEKLIRVDVISEQRGLGIEDSSNTKGQYTEKQRLNKLLREYYDRFLNPENFPEPGDLCVLQKQQEMEQSFSDRLDEQFKSPLEELNNMGYPGIGGNPAVEIAAGISGTDALQKSSSVRYRFEKNQNETLPESYLGLGFQNLIYLTFRLLEFRDRWMREGKSKLHNDESETEIESIHLVLVEEPEVNLHAQVQRVFIENAYKTLRNHSSLNEKSVFQTQLVVSTHSSHIVNDVDFKNLRYFRRLSSNNETKMDHTSIENMSELFSDEKTEMRFVSKHLKLTHCDIFFADGVIFVEGQAERLLVPEFITQNFKDLSRRYLSILEVSGAHTHKYRSLIEKLGVITLIVTDLDSRDTSKKACPPQRNQGQTTSNHTLKIWHPKKYLIDDLVDIPRYEGENSTAPLFVAYQKPVKFVRKEVLSRTFEDALILENFDHPHFNDIKSKIKVDSETTEDDLFKYVKNLTKGNFAFNCLAYITSNDSCSFKTPEYIKEGLDWLQKRLSPSS